MYDTNTHFVQDFILYSNGLIQNVSPGLNGGRNLSV